MIFDARLGHKTGSEFYDAHDRLIGKPILVNTDTGEVLRFDVDVDGKLKFDSVTRLPLHILERRPLPISLRSPQGGITPQIIIEPTQAETEAFPLTQAGVG